MRISSCTCCWVASLCAVAIAERTGAGDGAGEGQCENEDWGVCRSGEFNVLDLDGSRLELTIAEALDGDGPLGLRPSGWPPAVVFIDEIIPGSLADRSGLLLDDEVLQVGGRDVADLDQAEFLKALKARPLRLSVRRHTVDATPEDFERRFHAKRCYIGEGEEFDWSPMDMTLYEAYNLCRDTDGCRAVTGSPGGVDFKDGFRTSVTWYFKKKYECIANPQWVTLAMLKDDEDEIVAPLPPFSPPSPDIWRSIPGATFLSEDPVIVQFDNFLSAEEADHIIDLGTPLLANSTVGQSRELDYSSRTSQTAWLDSVDHWRDPVLKGIDEKIERLTMVARRSMEHNQVLRYEPGQYYHIHHDFIVEQKLLPCGPRVATFFMYLNDMPEGGNTTFPQLGLEVQPVKGRAVLWWNFDIRKIAAGAKLEELREDLRVEHVAKPAVGGTKWGVNKWLHSGDFVNNHRLGLLF